MKLSSIRIKLNPVQLCHMLDLLEALGGKSGARASYASSLQKLVEHFITMSLHQGLIPPVTLEDALVRLSTEVEDLALDRLTIKAVESSLAPVQNVAPLPILDQRKLEDALIKKQAEENAGLGDLFK